MKETAIVQMDIPEGAVPLEETANRIDFSDYARGPFGDEIDGNLSTNKFIGWATVNTAGVAASIPDLLVDGAGFITVATGISLAIQGVVALSGRSIKALSANYKQLTKEIDNTEWEQSKNIEEADFGIRIRSNSAESIAKAIANPKRIFKKVLVNETLWYNPSQDIFTRDRTYVGAFGMSDHIERFEGRRATARKLLNSIEGK